MTMSATRPGLRAGAALNNAAADQVRGMRRRIAVPSGGTPDDARTAPPGRAFCPPRGAGTVLTNSGEPT
ncbi:hypothetical protein POI8812_01875 [Pontivivens insulae]|uniref:Uncharacterized protein n=1 Tax=Pontivivens insulae TaxID=1639689 RepID=A0A2R8ABG9_9RHOB|nr:hypothetical protein DFR53_3298 [Pontivivens insulae]SPF29563.1 hypothetical protein POI8812_01875 [Pontivivens insulae]